MTLMSASTTRLKNAWMTKTRNGQRSITKHERKTTLKKKTRKALNSCFALTRRRRAWSLCFVMKMKSVRM